MFVLLLSKEDNSKPLPDQNELYYPGPLSELSGYEIELYLPTCFSKSTVMDVGGIEAVHVEGCQEVFERFTTLIWAVAYRNIRISGVRQVIADR